MRIDGMITRIIILSAVVAGGYQAAYGQNGGSVLLIQRTPADGGRVSPTVGVHYYEPSAHVRLTAVAKSGYQFVYWLGDVGDPTSPATVVQLNSPKIVVAVFERVGHDLALTSERSLSAPTGGVFGAGGDYARGGFSGGGGQRPVRYSSVAQPPTEPDADELAVPESNDFPVPVPEPTTVLLLAFGSILCRAARRDRRSSTRRVTQ